MNATPTDQRPPLTTPTKAPDDATLCNGQRLYEAWHHGIGRHSFTLWEKLDSRTRSTWDLYGKNPAAIGRANEPWARAVLGEACPS